MLRSLVAGIVALPGIIAVAGPACSHFPYKELEHLSKYPAVQSYCSAHFPLPHCSTVVTASITATFSTSVTATDRTITTVTGTETETTTTGTSTLTKYSSTTTSYVYTTTHTVSSTTATTTSTTDVGETIITTTATPTTVFTTATATATLSSGTVTTTTDTYNSIVAKLLESSVIKTACSCMETQPPCATITSVVSYHTTKTSTIYATAVVDRVTTITTAVEAVTTLTTGTSTTISTDTTTIVFVEKTVVESVKSTLTTIYTPAAPTDTITATVTTTVPKATATVTRSYDLAFGPVNGCAYLGGSFLDQSSGGLSSTTTTEQYLTFCAQFCDQTPGCVSFGANLFPPCQGTGISYYCSVMGSKYTDSSELECGIGTSYNGCPIYQNGTVYNLIS